VGCNFCRGREPHPAAAGPADVGGAASAGGVDSVTGHYGARYSAGQTLPGVPLDGGAGADAAGFRGSLDAIAVLQRLINHQQPDLQQSSVKTIEVVPDIMIEHLS